MSFRIKAREVISNEDKGTMFIAIKEDTVFLIGLTREEIGF